MTVLPPNLQPNNFQKKSSLEDELEIEKNRMQIGTEEMQEELKETWNREYAHAQIFPDKFATSSPEVIDFLLSFQNTLFYNDLARKFNLNQKQRDTLPQIIWQVCLNKQWEQLRALIQNNLSIGLPITEQIVTSLNQNILLKARELSQQSFAAQGRQSGFQSETEETRIMPLTLGDALKQYPEIGEQLITSEHISLKNFPEPVRPSIKNWLADYTFTLGYEKHSSVERNNYVFHGSNSLYLSSPDRQKLAYILKAHDDGSPVTVNKNLKQVIFPAASVEPRSASAPQRSVTPPIQPTLDANRGTGRPVTPQPTFRQTPRPMREQGQGTQPLQSGAIHQSTFFHNDTPPQPINASARPAENLEKPARINDQKTPTTANISFSSAQKLPYEKISADPPLQQDAPEPQPAGEKHRSFIIRPVFSQPAKKIPARNASRSDASGEPKPLPKNVVNLKEDK
jgi:hypothetical protein